MMLCNHAVKGLSTGSPRQGHIAQVPLCFVSDISRTVEVGIVFSTDRANEKTLRSPFAFASADMAGFAGVCLAGRDDGNAHHLGFVFNHFTESVIGHITNDSVEPSALCPLPDTLEVSKDYARVGRISEAHDFLTDLMENVAYATVLLVANPCYILVETSFLQSFPQPTEMPSYPPNLFAEKLCFHYASITQNHRSCGEAFSKVHSKDRFRFAYFRSIKLEGKHDNMFAILLDYFAFTEFGFIRERSMWLDGDFDTTTNTMNRNFEKPEGFGLFKVDKVVAKAEAPIPQSLLFVCGVEFNVLNKPVKTSMVKLDDSLNSGVFPVKDFLLSIGQLDYSSLYREPHSYCWRCCFIYFMVAVSPSYRKGVLATYEDKMWRVNHGNVRD